MAKRTRSIIQNDPAKLRAQRDDAIKVAAERYDAIERLRDEAGAAAQRIAQLETNQKEQAARLGKEREALIVENNQLRDRLYEAERELSRREGYMQAIEDSAPPVPEYEPRPSCAIFGDPRRFSPSDFDAAKTVSTFFDHNREAPRRNWYHR